MMVHQRVPCSFITLLITTLLATILQDSQKQLLPPATEETPASIGILLDSSASMRDKRDAAVEALKEFVKASPPEDEFFVVNFNHNAYMDANFTKDHKAVIEAFGHMDPQGGKAFNDAIVAWADNFREGAKNKKRAIVLVTNGIDKKSHSSYKTMLANLHQTDMPAIYAIGLFDPVKAEQERKDLDLLAQETGGMTFYPKDQKQFNEMARQITQEIKSRNKLDN